MKNDELIMYQPTDKNLSLEVRLEHETLWINRQQMALLFNRDIKTIGKHIQNALKEELINIPTVANFATVQTEGSRLIERNIEYYNLDMILSVGYRVKSQEGIYFRMWANKILKEYIIKGYTIQKPATIDDLNQLRSELKNAVADLEQQISNSEAFTEQQIADIYTTLVEMFSRKQIEEQARKPIGFLLPKQKK